jgi:ubiquinone/menaquinone biosynthesis C-methylase UbiE
MWFESLPEIEYVTADLDRPDVQLKMDLTNIELPDARFDAIICCHVLEHVVDDHKAISELYRVLKPGGWAILQVPISPNSATYEDCSIVEPSEQERAFGQQGHVRIYGMDYLDRLQRAGLTVKVFRWQSESERFGGRENIFGLIENEPLFFARRPA